MFDFVLKTRIKYLAIFVVCLFCVILFFSSVGDHSDEERHLGNIRLKKSKQEEYLQKLRETQTRKSSASAAADPIDYRVRFVSGKEIAHEVDNEHKAFQLHRVKLVNMERVKVLVECQDPFSSFGKLLVPGASYEFRVTDLFAKRHYWCSAKYGSSEFLFRAYGEGAPRDNNVITLHKEGAFINGENQIIEDSPMKYKQPKHPALNLYDKQQNLELQLQQS